ncbi:hypothetical protein [Thermoleptolyngbya sp.]
MSNAGWHFTDRLGEARSPLCLSYQRAIAAHSPTRFNSTPRSLDAWDNQIHRL